MESGVIQRKCHLSEALIGKKGPGGQKPQGGVWAECAETEAGEG